MSLAGYFTRYSTSVATAYFPGSTSASTVLDRAGYFTGYFTSVATAYFPGSTPEPIPMDLADAVAGLVNARLVPSPLHWFGTGVAPEVLDDGTRLDLPYAVMGEPDEDDTNWTTSGDRQSDGHFTISIYGGDKLATRALAKQLASLLNDAALLFEAGTLVYLRQVSRTMSLDPDPGPAGEDVWQEIRLFRYLYSSNLSQGN